MYTKRHKAEAIINFRKQKGGTMTNFEKLKNAESDELISMLDRHGFCSAVAECREYDSCENCIRNWISKAE